jgi:hypothetical protein
MQELKKSKNKYSVNYMNGIITICANKVMRVASVFWDNERSNLLIAVNLDLLDNRSNLDYIILDQTMKIVDVFTETEGIMPSFLMAPDKTVWVRLTSTNTDKIRESILPLENRRRIQNEKLLTEFVDYYSILFQQERIYFSKDLFNKAKQDKIGQYIFDKNNLFKIRKTYNIPLPSHTMAMYCDDKLQIINTIYPKKILHREMQLDGVISRQREFSLGMEYHHVYPVKISFDGDSIFYVTSNNEMFEISIDKMGCVVKSNLMIQLKDVKDYFYNIWEPIFMGETYVVRFNFEDGDGYIVIKHGEAMECWIKYNGDSAYKDVLSNRVIELESGSLKLTDIQKMSNFKCALVYSKVNVKSLDENIKIFILNV